MTDRRRLALLALTICCAAVAYAAGNGSVALWDRDEPRYAQTSREMLASGDWVVPQFLHVRRTAKPPLIYWCQATAMRLLGDRGEAANFAARLPSTVAITVLLVGLSAVLWRPLGSQRTLWTVVIFATSGLTFAAAKMCITDAVLLVWVTAAQLCLYAAWRGRATWPVVIVWAVAIGLAGLTKGPVILGMQGATLGVLGALRLWDWWREGRLPFARLAAADPVPDQLGYEPSHRPATRPPLVQWRCPSAMTWAKVLVALVIVEHIVMPWVLLVNQRSEGFIQAALGHEVRDRMLSPLEQHYGPPGYYLASIWATFFPWSLLLPLAIGLAITGRADPRRRFALAAVVGPWLLLEPIRTKLPHYLLPAFPPLAFLTADALVRCLSGEVNDLRGRTFKVAVTVWAVVIAAVASAPWLVVGRYAPLPLGWMAGVSILGVAFAATVTALIWAERLRAAAVAMAAGTLLIVTVVYGGYLPRASFLQLSPRLATVLMDRRCIMLDYKEPSLAWAQGGSMREAGQAWFGPAFDGQLPPWLVMTPDVFDRAPAAYRDQFKIVADEYGLAYADHGRWEHVLVVHRRR